MAQTNFDPTNKINVSGPLTPTTTDTPVDLRTRIKVLADITEIPLAYKGMIIYCEADDKYYRVKTLKSKFIGTREVPDYFPDQYEEYKTSDVVDIDNYKTEGAILPLNSVYVYRGKPTHAISGFNDHLGVDFIAVCYAHESESSTDQSIVVYKKEYDGNYVFNSTFDTDEIETDLQRFIASSIGATAATEEYAGLMSAQDKKTLRETNEAIESTASNAEAAAQSASVAEDAANAAEEAAAAAEESAGSAQASLTTIQNTLNDIATQAQEQSLDEATIAKVALNTNAIADNKAQIDTLGQKVQNVEGAITGTIFDTVLNGKDVTLISFGNCEVKQNVTYRAKLDKSLWEIPSTLGDGYVLFEAYQYDANDTIIDTIVRLTKAEASKVKMSYDFTTLASAAYVKFNIRIASGDKVRLSIESSISVTARLSDAESKIEMIEDSVKNSATKDDVNKVRQDVTEQIRNIGTSVTLGTLYKGRFDATGAMKAQLGFTDYFEVKPNTELNIGLADDLTIRIAEYDESKVYIADSGAYINRNNYTVGENTKYVRIAANYGSRGFSVENPIDVSDYREGDFYFIEYKIKGINEIGIAVSSLSDSLNSFKNETNFGINGNAFVEFTKATAAHSSSLDRLAVNIAKGYSFKVTAEDVDGVFTGTTGSVYQIYANGMSSSTNIYIGRTYSFTTANDVVAIGLYMSATTSSGRIKLIVSDVPSSIIPRLEALEKGSSSKDDVVAQNEPAEMEYKLELLNRPFRKGSSFTAPAPIVFLHITDAHVNNTNNLENLKRVIQFKNHYSSYIKDIISTGDQCYNTNTEGFDYWKNTEGASDILMTTGNHECNNASGTIKATQSEVYDIFFASLVDNWITKGAMLPPSYSSDKTTYFYKDYVTEGSEGNSCVRLICLDVMFQTEAQTAWLKDVLADALSKDYSVVCAEHFPPDGNIGHKIQCSFSVMKDLPLKDSAFNVAYAALKDFVTIVQTFFIDRGGKFCCWLCGHIHADMIAVYNDYPQQIFIAGNCEASATGNARANETIRTSGTRFRDSFNLVSVDAYSGYIRLKKVGANIDRHLRKIDSLLYNYITHEFVEDKF